MNAVRTPDGSQGYFIQPGGSDKEEQTSVHMPDAPQDTPPSPALSQTAPLLEERKIEEAYTRLKVESYLEEKTEDNVEKLVQFLKGIDHSESDPLFDQQEFQERVLRLADVGKIDLSRGTLYEQLDIINSSWEVRIFQIMGERMH